MTQDNLKIKINSFELNKLITTSNLFSKIDLKNSSKLVLRCLIDFAYKSQPSSLIAFEGALTRLAQKRPTVSTDLLQAANKVHTRDNGFVGIFPPEFIQAIKKNLGDDCCPQKIKECIEGTKATFADVTKLFEQIDVKINTNIEKHTQNLNYKAILKKQLQRIKQKVFINPEKMVKFYQKMETKFLPDKNFITSVENHASNVLEAGLKKNKLVPDNSKIIVKRLKDGCYGTAYKIDFTDEKNCNIFKSKVIKYYKNLGMRDLVNLNFQLKNIEIIKENYDTFVPIIKCVFKIASSIQKIFKISSKRNIKSFTEDKITYFSDLSQLKNRTMEQQKNITLERMKSEMEERYRMHGSCRETNIENYIRQASGNDLRKSDLIKYYYTDLNHNYSVLDFSSYKNIGPTSKKVDYDSLGVEPTDIKKTGFFTNLIEGHLIDYGGFEIRNKVLGENPVARRVYKKIKHIEGKNSTQRRIDRINELYEKASKNKLPQSSNVLLGLTEARKLIPENHQNKLLSVI